MGKTLILSDIHFCKKSSTCTDAVQLRSLWQDCSTLILNGDTTQEFGMHSAEQSKKCTDELVRLATEDGVSTILICGNHDPQYKNHHVWLQDSSVLVTHGHIAFEGVAPWSWRAPHIAKAKETYLAESGDGFEEQLVAIQKASTDAATGAFHSRRPSTFGLICIAIPCALKVLIGWASFPTRMYKWATKYAPSAKVIITGHTHRAGTWKRGGTTIINTGCFGFPSHPRAVVIENNLLTVYKIKKVNGDFTFAQSCFALRV